MLFTALIEGGLIVPRGVIDAKRPEADDDDLTRVLRLIDGGIEQSPLTQHFAIHQSREIYF
jgi:hypothetical protein